MNLLSKKNKKNGIGKGEEEKKKQEPRNKNQDTERIEIMVLAHGFHSLIQLRIKK